MSKQLSNLLIGTLLLSPAIFAPAAEYVPKIITGVVKMDSWHSTSDQKEGIYRLEAVPGGTLTQVNEGRDVYMAPLGGAVYEDGKMKGIHFRTFSDPMSSSGVSYGVYSVEYDMDTWERTKFKSLGDLYGNLISSCGVTKDPLTGLNYGIFFNFNMDYEVIDRKLCTIDYTSDIPKKQQICVMSEPFAAIAAGSNGRLYGISREGYLYTINKSTGNMTLIGDLYISDISANPSSMTFDPRTEKLYWSYVSVSGESFLYEINYNVGEVSATKIMQLPENAVLVNMYIAAPEAEDGAPAAVEDLSVSFTGESLTGTVGFSMPVMSYDGEPLSGNLSYTVYADGDIAVTGEASPGAAVSREVTVTGGDMTFKVTASNAGGEGAPSEKSLYVGPDTPLPVTDPEFSYNPDNGQVSLSWTPPTTGTHGITLTQSNLTYRIVRQPGDVVVAENHPSSSFAGSFSYDGTLKAFLFEITPRNGTLSGEKANTNKVVIGTPVDLPYSETFTSDSGFDICTVIDANHDGTSWERYHYESSYTGISDHARITAHNENKDDDWLLLPPMKLEKGAIYSLKFDAKKQFLTADCNQLMEIGVGTGDDPLTYSVIMNPFSLTNVNFSEYACMFEVPADGIYHVGFHAISEAASAALDIDRVTLRMETSGEAPEAVSDLVLTPDPSGELKASVSFKTPAYSRSGKPLESLSRVEVVTSDGSTLATNTDVTPGNAYTMQLTGLANGYETYTVRAVNEKGNGTPAEVRVFIGQDVPEAPRNVILKDLGDDIELSWSAPGKGANGLYVNPDKMNYTLYSYDERGYLTVVAENISSPYITDSGSSHGEQSLVYYALSASTTGGEGEPAATNGLIIGEPYVLPYAQSFADAEWGDRFVWLEGEYADWNIGLTRDLASDDDGGSLAFIPNRAEFGNFNLGKVTLKNSVNPTLMFDCYVIPSSLSTLSVAVDRFPQGVAETLTTVRFDKDTEEGWKPVTVDLRNYLDDPFVIVKFAMASSSKEYPVVIDNIRIIDELSGVHRIEGATNAAAYDVYGIDGTVVRSGAPDLDNLTPGLYIVNGEKVLIK